MQPKFPNSRLSQLREVVGADDQEAVDFLFEYFESLLKDAKRLEEIEKEKSPEVAEFIEKIQSFLRVFLEEFGIETYLPIPQNAIHVIDKDDIPPDASDAAKKYLNLKGGHGFWLPLSQEMVILRDFSSEKLNFLLAFVHEALHAQSFLRLEKIRDPASDMRQRIGLEVTDLNDSSAKDVYFTVGRDGFTIYKPDGKNFDDITEAVTEELTIRFENRFGGAFDEIQPELEAREQYIRNMIARGYNEKELRFSIESMHEEHDEARGFNVRLSQRGHQEARIKLNNLIDELYEKNQADFASREDIFMLFVKAIMHGELLPVARLIEKTFGKGSFRIIGEHQVERE